MHRKSSAILTIVMLLGLFINLLTPWVAEAQQLASPAATGPDANAVNEQANLTGFQKKELAPAPPLLLSEQNAANPALAAPNAEVAAVLATAKQIAAGFHFTCAVTASGGVKCWGDNWLGQLGDGTTMDHKTPVGVSGLSSGVVAIAAGDLHTCALTTGGGVKCWGYNRHGQLGDDTTVDRRTPVDVSGLSSGVAAIAAGTRFTCALMTSGGVKCWGDNGHGNLGDGTTVDRRTPVDVIGLSTDVTSIATGGFHTCALMTNGGVKCWGDNFDGQLGDGTTVNRKTPVDVSGLSSGVAAIAAGDRYTCALMTSGGVKCWGENYNGQLGDGTTISRRTPVDVSGLGNSVKAITAGGWHTCALMVSGGIKCWGADVFGQLGDGTTTSYRTMPVAVRSLSNGVATIVAGGQHTCALMSNGGIKCWGRNQDGELGGNTTTDRPTPVNVAGFGPPPAVTLTAQPTTVVADAMSSASVTLSNAPAGHLVRLRASLPGAGFDVPMGMVDANGAYRAQLRSSTPGDAVVTAVDETTGETFATSAAVTFTPVAGQTTPPPGKKGQVTITDIRADHPLDARYLQGIPVDNRIQVTVDWGGLAPGFVDFILNGQTFREQASGDIVSHTFDMGNDLHPGQNTLRIVARAADGAGSLSQDFAPTMTAAPVWLSGLAANGMLTLPASASGDLSGKSTYEMGFHLPPYKFDLTAPGLGPSDLGFTWDFQGKMSMPLDCESALKAYLEAAGGLEFGDASMDVKGKAGLTADRVQVCAFEMPHGFGEVEAEGTFTAFRKPVLVMITYFNAAVGTAVDNIVVVMHIEGILAKVLGEIYVDVNPHVGVESDIFLQTQSPYFRFENLGVSGGLGVEGGYRLKSVVEVKVWAGADGTVKFMRAGPVEWPPTDDWHFDSITLQGEVGAKFRAGWFERKAKGTIEWTYPPTSMLTVEALQEGMDVTDWRLIPHIQAPAHAYARFHAPTPERPAPFSQDALMQKVKGLPALTPGALAATVDDVLVSNVYTYTEPALALDPANDHVLLAWVYDDPNKQIGQSTEIAYSYWDGVTWRTPGRITDDTYPDAAPTLAWDDAGHGLALWQRLDDPNLPITATLDVTTTSKIEIAWSQYDPATDSWTSPAWLTRNDVLDQTPAAAANANGDVLAVWRQNPANIISGDETDPDRIMVAFWNGTGWDAPTAAVEDIPGLVDLAVGYGASEATIAYTQYMTPTGSVTPTLQLFTSAWDGSAWSAPQQLTDDDLGHRHPAVVYNNQNHPWLVWQAGPTLRIRDQTTAAQADLTLPEGMEIDEFRVLHDGDDNLAAVFTAQDEGQRDLFVAFYDATHNVWGSPIPLTDDLHSEGYPAPALDSSGRLLMAYARTEVHSEQRTTTDPTTDETITYTLPVEGQTDLITLSHQFVKDAAVGGLTFSDSHPAPGAAVTMTATITNTGDLPLPNLQVGFYDGDPAAGGSLLDTSTIPGLLAAGYTATVTATLTAPASSTPHILAAMADPQNQIDEINEANNVSLLSAFGPDLTILDAAAIPWGGSDVGLKAVVQNLGPGESLTATVAYHWDVITGTLIITDTIPPLSAGETYTQTTPWNFGALPEGAHTLAAAVNPDQSDFPELVVANNSIQFPLESLPDLTVSPYYFWTDMLPDGGVAITLTVSNNGSVASAETSVNLYLNQPFTDTARIGVLAVPSLQPGEATVLTYQWTPASPASGDLYAAVNEDRAVSEWSWANNLASAGMAVAVNDLDLQLTSGDVQLQWSDVGGAVTRYELWRAESPYFKPDDVGASLRAYLPANPGGLISYIDGEAHAENAAVNDYYLVISVSNDGQESRVSNRVGAFTFTLTPGGP